jgi:hypothetical protein
VACWDWRLLLVAPDMRIADVERFCSVNGVVALPGTLGFEIRRLRMLECCTGCATAAR